MQGDVEILVDGTWFRVCGLRRIVRGHLENVPLREGMVVQQKVLNKDKGEVEYENVCFIKPYELCDVPLVYLEDFNFKTVEILDTTNMLLIQEYRHCVDFAKNAVLDIISRDFE